MTQRDPIKPPYANFDYDDGSDCFRFLDECVSALLTAVSIREPDEPFYIVAEMLEAEAARLKRKRGRPPGSRNKKRAPPGSPSTIARRRREERQRAEEERLRAASREKFSRIAERYASKRFPE